MYTLFYYFTGDHWKVELSSTKFWEREKPVRLVHVDTGMVGATSRSTITSLTLLL